MFIRTERLLLRPVWPEDVDDLFDLLCREWASEPLSPERSAGFRKALEAFVKRPHEPRFPHFLITLREPGAMRSAGSASLSLTDGEAELGYWIARPFRGQRLAEEAVKAILDHARSLGHQRVLAWHFNEDDASGHVLRHCGFEPTGRTCERHHATFQCVLPAEVYVADLEQLAGPSATIDTQESSQLAG